MYLFARSRRMNPGKVRAARAAAIDIAGRVSQITGRDCTAWLATWSPEFGTVAWTMNVETLQELETAGDKLAMDADFGDTLEAIAGLFDAQLQDNVLQMLTATPPADGAVPEYATVTQGVCANGHIAEAMTVGLEIAEAATRVTGSPVGFGSALTGEYGGVAWVATSPDVDTVERANAAMASDADFAKLVDRAGPLFQPGVGATLYRRLH